MTVMDVVRGGTFGAAITATSIATRRLCPDASFDASRAPLQPPPWVFGVIWPVLFVTTGAAWALDEHSTASDALFASLTLLCCAWLPLYTCLRYRRVSTVVLAASVAIAGATLVVGANAWRWLMAPLVAWLVFATYLNAYRALDDA